MSFRHIKGAGRLQRQLGQAPKIWRETLDKTLAKAGAEMARSARALVPVATGALKDSIGHRVTDSRDGFGRAVEVFAGDEAAFYARIVEGKQPYFNPAFQVTRRLIKKRILSASARAAKKIAGVR